MTIRQIIRRKQLPGTRGPALQSCCSADGLECGSQRLFDSPDVEKDEHNVLMARPPRMLQKAIPARHDKQGRPSGKLAGVTRLHGYSVQRSPEPTCQGLEAARRTWARFRARASTARDRTAFPADVPFVIVTLVVPGPSAWTSANSVAALEGASRTQPCEARRPSERVALLPWIACPRSVKKIECGIGASSHSLE
jgi:hypothetical protein